MCDTSSDDDSIHEISSDAPGTVPIGTNYSLPEKSKSKYIKAYNDFMRWKTSKNWNSFKEKVIVAYFLEMSDKFKSTSLYTIYSMLKSMLMIHHEVDISKYSMLLTLLKRKALACTVKKSKTFTADEVNQFMKEAHNYEHLLTKVALIFGIVGRCRRHELYNLRFNDVEVYPSKILVKIYNMVRATSTASSYRIFTVTGNYYELCKKYMSLRPEACKVTNFFVQYRSGKCKSHPVGINQLGILSKSIARFLDLPDPDLYTGHSFRRTSANILINFDEDILTLKANSELKTVPAPAIPALRNHNTTDSTFNNKTASENRSNTNTTILEDRSSHKKNNFQASNQFPNTFENQNFECVNINIPNTTTLEDYTSDSMDSKSQVWNQIQNSIVNNPRLSYNPIQNSLENNPNKVVNINIPATATSSDLQESLSALVCFSNSKIHNVNINYTK